MGVVRRQLWRLFPLLTMCMAMTGCGLLMPRLNPGDVIFQDDFARVDSGWDHYSDENYTADYLDGGYQIRVDGTYLTAWSLPGIEQDDVLIRVESKYQAGPVDNVFGVICRYIDGSNFHFFMISSDGYAGIGMYAAGEKSMLNDDSLLPTDAIYPVDEINLIQAACIGEKLTLWVNGTIVAEAMTTSLSGGDVGLLVGTYEQGGVAILFDNFSTLMP